MILLFLSLDYLFGTGRHRNSVVIHDVYFEPRVGLVMADGGEKKELTENQRPVCGSCGQKIPSNVEIQQPRTK